MKRRIKCVLVGDVAVGKTCLCIAYSRNQFPESYVPTVFDNYSVELEHSGQRIDLQLWDTAGQADFRKIRMLSYTDADVFLICFSLVSPESLENARTTWITETKEKSPNAKVVLVGTKSDLREDFENWESRGSENRVVERKEAEEAAQSMGVDAYIECSAKKLYNVQEVFTKTIETVIRRKSRGSTKKKSCDVC